MEDILEVYKRSYDETYPLICMDESSKQHIKETRQPIPAKPGTVERVRERLVQEGIESALNRAKLIRVRSRVIDGEWWNWATWKAYLTKLSGKH